MLASQIGGALGIGVFSIGLCDRIAPRLGAKTALVSGMSLIALGLALLSGVSVGGEYAAEVLPSMVLAEEAA